MLPNTWCHKEQRAKASEFLQSRSVLANELEISETKEKKECFVRPHVIQEPLHFYCESYPSYF